MKYLTIQNDGAAQERCASPKFPFLFALPSTRRNCDDPRAAKADSLALRAFLCLVLSFMTQWANGPPRSPTQSPSAPSSPSVPTHQQFQQDTPKSPQRNGFPSEDSVAKPRPSDEFTGVTPRPRASTSSRPASRRDSLAQAYQPPVMEINEDTPAELQPIFTYLNSHSNKLYQEGYFLKLHDLDSRKCSCDAFLLTSCNMLTSGKQVEGRVQIEYGMNASRNSSALSFRYGMPHN